MGNHEAVRHVFFRCYLLAFLMMMRLVSVLILVIAGSGNSVWAASMGVEELPDLTGGVVPVVQYKHLDPFSGDDILTSVSEVEYVVRVKNQTGDPLIADSLILVVDSIQEISGKEISGRVKIQGSDGVTENGKNFFKIPSTEVDLPPYGESQSVTIRVTNPDFLRFYPPQIRVRGIRRSSGKATKDLLDTLVQKGLLSPEDAMRALKNSSPVSP